MTPAGSAGQVRPHRSASDEEAHRPPRGKQASGADINSHFNTANFQKPPYFLNSSVISLEFPEYSSSGTTYPEVVN